MPSGRLEDGAPIWNFIGAGHRATQFSSDALRIVIGERVSGDGSRKEVLETTLPFLRRMETIDDLVKVARDQANPCSTNDYILFYVELAAGHFDVALAILERRRGECFHDKDYYWFERDVSEDMRLRQIERLLLSGLHERIGQILRHWEERCARQAGVWHLWQPSPFPSNRTMTIGCAGRENIPADPPLAFAALLGLKLRS